jgi:hypothetical protein
VRRVLVGGGLENRRLFPNGNVVGVLMSSLDLGGLRDRTNAIYPIFKTF